MSNQLEFMDCPQCGKRILTTAGECHHCHHRRDKHATTRTKQIRNQPLQPTNDEDDTDDAALEHGGYDQTDDFDYEDYVAENFPEHTNQRPKLRVKLWVWITAWLLIIATLLPWLVQFMATQ